MTDLLTGTQNFTQWMDRLNAAITSTTAVASTPYTLLVTDRTVLIDASAGAVTIDLLAASSHYGHPVTFKKTDATANAVTIDGDGAETIDGATTTSLASQWDSVTIQTNGTEWYIVATS